MVFPFAISTSICRSSVTICSGLNFFIDTPVILQRGFSRSPGYKIPVQMSRILPGIHRQRSFSAVFKQCIASNGQL